MKTYHISHLMSLTLPSISEEYRRNLQVLCGVHFKTPPSSNNMQPQQPLSPVMELRRQQRVQARQGPAQIKSVKYSFSPNQLATEAEAATSAAFARFVNG